jgi:hypothetical protein|tara:strand:+ start:18 stop:518 length:501 start_codon:yes stop_codon:yes gene_type:complete
MRTSIYSKPIVTTLIAILLFMVWPVNAQNLFPVEVDPAGFDEDCLPRFVTHYDEANLVRIGKTGGPTIQLDISPASSKTVLNFDSFHETVLQLSCFKNVSVAVTWIDENTADIESWPDRCMQFNSIVDVADKRIIKATGLLHCDSNPLESDLPRVEEIFPPEPGDS